jgi:hypothetical protein
VWRWILSGVAIGLIGLAVFWAWPRPLPQTLLLVLSDDREERNILPPVPFVSGDVASLQSWAQAAKVPSLALQLSKVENPAWLARRLSPSPGENQLSFPRSAAGGSSAIKNGDMLVIYIKGHGLALDVSKNDKPDVRPLIVKSLSEGDLSAAWYSDDRHVVDVRELLQQLAAVSGVRMLVIFDAVHLNYDPRLGTLVNAFPTTVKQTLDQLPTRSNLWVLVGQGDGELAVGLSTAGRSALVDSLISGLTRKKNDPVGVSVDSLIETVRSQLIALNQPGRGSFRQTLQPLFPASGGAIAGRLTLPTSPPPPTADKPADQKSVTNEVAKAVANSAPVQTTTAPVQQAATAASTAAKSASDTKEATSQPSAGKEAASSTAAATSSATSPASAAPPSTQPSELELAWQSRDRLRDRFRTGWSPSHIGPQFWRRIEGLLAGFDEQRLAGEQAAKDQQTLKLLQEDLTRLESIFTGQGGTCTTDDCRALAESYAAFQTSPAFRSFQARQNSGLETANEALKVFAETAYRARDYVYLHGQMAAILDGGPFVNDAVLESLLDKLKALGSRLDPSDLTDGRLTDTRLRDLARMQRDVNAARDQAEADIDAYCRAVAAAPPSPGKMLRAQLLLHSPAVSARQRAELRKSSDIKGPSSESPGSSSEPSVSARLAANARLMKKLLAAVAPQTQSSGPNVPASPITSWMQLLDSAQGSADLLSWTKLGRGSREFAENLPASVKTGFSSRSASRPESTLLDTWRLYEAALLLDGRDARRWPDRSLAASWIAQPIRPELLPDKVELVGAAQPIQLHHPDQDAAAVSLAIRVQSEKPPPYTVAIDLNWNARDLDVTRGDGGAPLRSGRNEIILDTDKLDLPLRIKSRRTTTDSPNATIRAQARFGNAQLVSADLRCVLPRPDQIELTLSPDENLAETKRRTWFPSLPNGGRLNLFPNRERSVALYLTNLSSEDKHLFARLYRVPQAATSLGGRLFDIKSAMALTPVAATTDTKLSQPNADIAQLLRGQLLAQTNEKEPFLLPAGSMPVKVPLAPIAPPPPVPASTAPAANPDKNNDVTGGLLLVVTSADGKSKPYFKWIELQMLQPDDLLAIKEPTYREGKLSFRVELKDPKLIDEMALAKQPLKLTWETQALPLEIREPTKESLLTASDKQGAMFTAIVPPSVRWPLYLQLHVDGDPRGLVARLDRQNDNLLLTNLKENRPPDIHMWRVGASASRVGAPPERLQYLIRPPQPWLAFPTAATIAEGLPEMSRGQTVLVRIDPKAATARLDVSLGADVAAKYFADGARIRVTAEGQPPEFATERQIAVRLTGIDSSLLQIQCDASDFTRIDFGPIDVPQDKRIELTAEITSESTAVAASEYATSSTTFILDRTPPTIGQLQADRIPPRAVPAAGTPIQTEIVLRCRADDGEGSGIAKVEFVVGFDQNKNARLDDVERRPPIAGIKQSDGSYAAQFVVTGEPPSDQLLVEATSTDNVQQRSELAQTSLALPRQNQGGQRTTFGASKPGDDLGSKLQKMAPPAKK